MDCISRACKRKSTDTCFNWLSLFLPRLICEFLRPDLFPPNEENQLVALYEVIYINYEMVSKRQISFIPLNFPVFALMNIPQSPSCFLQPISWICSETFIPNSWKKNNRVNTLCMQFWKKNKENQTIPQMWSFQSTCSGRAFLVAASWLQRDCCPHSTSGIWRVWKWGIWWTFRIFCKTPAK